MDIALTKISSKGQIVIPSDMRENIPEGEKLVIIKTGQDFLIKKASSVVEKLKEDLEFARRSDEVIELYEKDPSKFRRMEFDDFIKELKKWERQTLTSTSKKNTRK